MTDEKRSRVLGMILGSVSRGQFPQREPVAFLYGHVAKEGETPTHTINGVGYVGAVLPNIGSIYTREVRNNFPYAFIYYHTEGSSFYVLRCHSEEPGVASKSNHTFIPYDTNNKGQFMSTVWGEGKTNSFGDPIGFTGALLSVTEGIIWTNFDLRYRGTNEVYFPKSPDPIPIYE